MRRVLSHTVVLWAILCAPAAAAQVRFDDSCRAPGEAARVTGTGFAPGSPFASTLDALPLGFGVVDELGTVSASFPAPLGEGSYLVRIADLLGNRGQAKLTVERATVEITPTPRRADTARVRFVVRGLGEDGASIYLHWVAPGGRHAGSRRLGTATGACGDLTSERGRLLPARPRDGRWRLQVDTRMSYDGDAQPRVVQYVRVNAA